MKKLTEMQALLTKVHPSVGDQRDRLTSTMAS